MLKRKNLLIIALIILVFISTTFTVYISLTHKHHNKNNNSTTTKTPSKPPAEPVKSDTFSEILITCVGDCTLGNDDKFTSNTLPEVLKQNNNDYSYFFKNVKSIFEKDDLTTANLETTFTNSNIKANKGNPPFYNFKGDPEYAKSLKLGSIEAVNLSNNHIYDYLQKGFDDTVNSLKSENINYFGEGTKYITTIKGIKFGFLGYTGYTNSTNFQDTVKNDISELKKQNCIVIINFHWGVENAYYPNDTQKTIAHFAIDNGADLIIGHHPHVIEGIEQYNNKIICYSLGNFCFGGNQNPNDKNTFIFQIKYKFTNNNLTSYGIKVIPCSISSVNYINDYCPTPLTDSKKNELLNKIKTLSPNLNLTLSDDFSFVTTN